MILLQNAIYIDLHSLKFSKSDILVSEGAKGKLEFFEPNTAKATETTKLIDCTGKYVTKSFVNAHHHIYSALATGMPPPKKSPKSFYEILQNVWWLLDQCLDEEIIKASAYAAAVACIKNGCTFVIDHHSSPSHISGSLDIIKSVFDEAGLSHLLCFEITDRNQVKHIEEALSETDSYLAQNQGLVGLHASFTISNTTLQKALQIADKHDTGIHLHVAEDDIDQRQCLNEYQMRVVERLYKQGALQSPKTLLVHSIHINNNEKDIIRNTPVWMVQNTESNLNNNVGVFNPEWLNDNIMLGTDGMHSNMHQSAKAAYFTGIGTENANPLKIYKRLRQAHRYIKTNHFEGDADNNLMVLDYAPFTDFNEQNFLGHFFYAMDSSCIKDVISNGKLILRDREIQTLDEEAVKKYTNEQSARLWQKMSGG